MGHDRICWLVGCFGFNGPLRQYFSLYRAVSQRDGKRGEKRIDESKKIQTTPTCTYYKRSRPLPYVIQTVGRPGTGSLPSIITPPDHPRPHLSLTIYSYPHLMVTIRKFIKKINHSHKFCADNGGLYWNLRDEAVLHVFILTCVSKLLA